MSSFTIPDAIRIPLCKGINLCTSGCEKVQNKYNELQGKVITAIQTSSPGYAPYAKKVIEALPETVFASAMFAGVGRTVAACIWAGRLAQFVAPLATTAITKGVDKDSMAEVFVETKKRCVDSIERFGPAMATVGAVGAVATAVAGIFRCNITLLMHSSLFTIFAIKGYQQMKSQIALERAPAHIEAAPAPAAAAIVDDAALASPE